MKRKAVIFLVSMLQLTIAQSKVPDIKVITATIQHWISGAPGGRSGTTYAIKVSILSNRPVTFKNLWIGKEHAAFDIQTFFSDPNKKPAQGDSVLLVYVKLNQPEKEAKKSKALPMKYKGEALVEYLVSGKPKYFTIKKFVPLEIFNGQ